MGIQQKTKRYIERKIQAYYNGNFWDDLRWKKLHDYKHVWNALVELRAKGQYQELQEKIVCYWGHSFGQIGLEKELIDELVECIKEMDSSKVRFLEQYEILIKKMEQCSFSKLSVAQWKRFSGLMTSNGLFRLGYICRGKSIERIKSQSGRMRGIFDTFVVEMEEQKYEQAGKTLARIKRSMIIRMWCKKILCVFEDFYAIMTQDSQKLSQNYNSEGKLEKAYYDLIDKAEVAIIGPAPVKIDDVEKMKKRTIIRFNDRGRVILPKEQEDIPTKISFYNGGCSKWIRNVEKKDFLYDLSYIVCQEQLINYYPDDIKERVKVAKNLNKLFLIGIPNALPFAMFDLLRCGKKSIQVYCNNLYLSKNVWSNKYNIHSQNEQKEMFWWPILAQHEMTSQFIFLQNMYRQGFIVADEELKWVLEHNIADYIGRMEELWVIDVIPYKMNVDWEEKKN